jgi:hypothetical protein
MAKYPTERAPAKVTKCPHCKWTGSARGIFSHVRLVHSGKEHELNIRKENPYVIEKSKPKALGAIQRRKTMGELKNEKNELEAFIGLIVVKVMQEYSKMHDPLFRAKR